MVKMKILMINEKYEYAGGAEQYLVDICSGLSTRGHEVRIVYGQEPKSQKLKIKSQKLKSFFVENLDCEGVLKVVEDFNPDVVNLLNVFDPRLYSLVKVKPTVRFVHDHQTYCPGNSKLWFRSNRICPISTSWRCAFYAYKEKCMTRRPLKLVREILKRSPLITALNRLDKVICNSSYVKNQLILSGVAGEKIVVNFLFPSGVGRGSHSNTLEYDSQTPVVLFVGRVFLEKGVEYLLRASAKIGVDHKVRVIGEGWDRERVTRLSGEEGIEDKVEFLGWLPREKVEEHYAACYLLVIPSIWPEPFGLTGLEAMAHAKPVVAFNVGGISDWLKDQEVGFLVERANVDELAGRIEQLLSDEKLAQKMGETGRKLVSEKFSLERHLDQLIGVYQKVITKR